MAGEYIKNKVLREDMLELISSECPVKDLSGATVFVTGATGLIGSQAIKAMICANREYGIKIRILAFCRNREKFERVFEEFLDSDDVAAVYGDVNNPVQTDERIDYIIHSASPTSSKYFVEYPAETIMTALEGTKNILELAREKEIKGMVYLSSLEVYGVPDSKESLVKEEQYGYIDPMSVRSSYSEGKRMAECLCASYAQEYGVPVKVARLSQTFGAGVEYQDGRVFAEFARCVMEKRNIVLHTDGKTLRTYCYTKDAVSALFFILLKGVTGEAYNVTNKDTAVTIREMAQCVCDIFSESQIAVEFDMPKDLASFGYNPEMVIRLDPSKLERLGWKATVDLKGMFIRMINALEERQRNK